MPREKSIAERFEAYVDAVGGRLFKPNRRFLRDALFGLLEGKSTLLSEIGRALDEPRRLIHTEKRLSRGLASPRYDDKAVEEDYLKLVAPFLRDEAWPRPTIAVDLTDISKPKARKMPYLCGVHDGSEDELANGYHVVSVEAVGARGRRLPLLARLFSSLEPDYRSHNTTVFNAVAAVAPHVPEDAFWVLDAGFDGKDFFARFDDMGLKFAVRLNHHTNRRLMTPVGNNDVRTLTKDWPRSYRHRTRVQGRASSWQVQVGWVCDVHLPLYAPSGRCTNKPGPVRYSVVTASGGNLGQQPLVLLTNEDVRSDAQAARVVECYLERWGIEEANRFTKQGFDLEDVRALT